MLEHIQSHPMGAFHLLLALASLAFGTMVIFARKGTVRHRWLGRCYLLSMLGLNFSALLIYELFGHFGPFHWMALFSLASIMGGYLPVRSRRPYWRHRHAHMMVGSYVGLVAATVAETASRIPGWSFGASVIISSVATVVVGIALMQRMLPATLRKP